MVPSRVGCEARPDDAVAARRDGHAEARGRSDDEVRAGDRRVAGADRRTAEHVSDRGVGRAGVGDAGTAAPARSFPRPARGSRHRAGVISRLGWRLVSSTRTCSRGLQRGLDRRAVGEPQAGHRDRDVRRRAAEVRRVRALLTLLTKTTASAPAACACWAFSANEHMPRSSRSTTGAGSGVSGSQPLPEASWIGAARLYEAGPNVAPPIGYVPAAERVQHLQRLDRRDRVGRVRHQSQCDDGDERREQSVHEHDATVWTLRGEHCVVALAASASFYTEPTMGSSSTA